MAQPHFLQTLKCSKSNPLLTIDDITWDYKKKRSIMFPSVIDMSDKLDSPIDRYYMYLASHGGREIGFATAPTLEGPWTMQKEAVLHLDNCPAIRGHLSSPEIIYCNNRFILYYHGGLSARSARRTKPPNAHPLLSPHSKLRRGHLSRWPPL